MAIANVLLFLSHTIVVLSKRSVRIDSHGRTAIVDPQRKTGYDGPPGWSVEIGSGGYGVVRLVRRRSDGGLVVAKTERPGKEPQNYSDTPWGPLLHGATLEHEAEILNKLSSLEHVLKCELRGQSSLFGGYTIILSPCLRGAYRTEDYAQPLDDPLQFAGKLRETGEITLRYEDWLRTLEDLFRGAGGRPIDVEVAGQDGERLPWFPTYDSLRTSGPSFLGEQMFPLTMAYSVEFPLVMALDPGALERAVRMTLDTAWKMLELGVANIDQAQNVLYMADGTPMFTDMGLAVDLDEAVGELESAGHAAVKTFLTGILRMVPPTWWEEDVDGGRYGSKAEALWMGMARKTNWQASISEALATVAKERRRELSSKREASKADHDVIALPYHPEWHSQQ